MPFLQNENIIIIKHKSILDGISVSCKFRFITPFPIVRGNRIMSHGLTLRQVYILAYILMDL